MSGVNGCGWELEQVIKDIRRAEVIVEIGTHRGGSLRVWRNVFDPLVLIGIDPSDENTPAGWTTPATALEVGAVMVRKSSFTAGAIDDVGHVLRGKSIDLLYIDGDHTLNAVEMDLAYYTPLLSADGVLVLDDAVRTDVESDCGPRLMYERLRDRHRTKLIYDGHGGTGVAMVWL